MIRIRRRRRGPQPSWQAADFDSFEVLASVGRRRPARRVTRARTPRDQRTVRRAVRATLRAARTRSGLHWPATSPHRGTTH